MISKVDCLSYIFSRKERPEGSIEKTRCFYQVFGTVLTEMKRIVSLISLALLHQSIA